MSKTPMIRIEGDNLTIVYNLQTEDKLVYTDLTPEQAVCAAHAAAVGRAGDLIRARELFGPLLKRSGYSVLCGDFATLSENGKRRYLEGKARHAEEISLRTGAPVVYFYDGDRFAENVPQTVAVREDEAVAPMPGL